MIKQVILCYGCAEMTLHKAEKDTSGWRWSLHAAQKAVAPALDISIMGAEPSKEGRARTLRAWYMVCRVDTGHG